MNSVMRVMMNQVLMSGFHNIQMIHRMRNGLFQVTTLANILNKFQFQYFIP